MNMRMLRAREEIKGDPQTLTAPFQLFESGKFKLLPNQGLSEHLIGL